MKVRCGQCVGCRMQYRHEWAVRMCHEAELHDENSFLTLTYDDEHLPPGGSLNVEDWQKFAKRARKRFGRFRYYQCGEYGDLGRPHHHAAIFGRDWGDTRKFLKTAPKSKLPLYVCEKLTETWGKGAVYIGELTPESAGYIAGYIYEKVTGEAAKWHYSYTCPHTGKVTKFKPEYSSQSRKPGIGSAFLERHSEQFYLRDSLTHHGKWTKPPRYYDKLFEKQNPERMKSVKAERDSERRAAEQAAPDKYTERRRMEREYCAERRIFLRSSE